MEASKEWMEGMEEEEEELTASSVSSEAAAAREKTFDLQRKSLEIPPFPLGGQESGMEEGLCCVSCYRFFTRSWLAGGSLSLSLSLPLSLPTTPPPLPPPFYPLFRSSRPPGIYPSV